MHALDWYDERTSGEDKDFWLQQTRNGQTVAIEACAQFMDSDLREELHASGDWQDAPESEWERAFLEEYCRIHEQRFGQEFVVT